MNFNLNHVLYAALAALMALCLWQHARINSLKAELVGIETALVRAHADAVKATLETTTHIISARDAAYAGVHDARTEAAKAIAALPEDRGGDAVGRPPRVVAVDDFLPLPLSDALVMQSQSIRAGCGGDSPADGAVCRKNASTAPGGAGQPHDASSDGRMAQPLHGLGR